MPRVLPTKGSKLPKLRPALPKKRAKMLKIEAQSPTQKEIKIAKIEAQSPAQKSPKNAKIKAHGPS